MPHSGPKIIGGLFGLEAPCLSSGGQRVPFSDCSRNYFLSARCAIYTVCRFVRPKMVWLPSYLCGAILDPLNRLSIPFRYYNAGPNFKPGSENWTCDVKEGDLV